MAVPSPLLASARRCLRETLVLLPLLHEEPAISEQCITYRVCWLDVPTNRLAAELIEAASDEAAIARVEDGGFGSKCEIWHGRRLVAQIEETRLQA